MSNLMMTKGLPGSGKSTWAKEYLTANPNTVRVNKDELRSMLHNGVHSEGREKFVLAVRNFIVEHALSQGQNVIVDDTNFSSKHENRLRDIAKIQKAEFVIEDFTDVPLEECIKRDKNRANYVGEKVIRDMYKQYLKPRPQVVEHIEGYPDAIICDLDGTLALFGNANPYERDFLQDKVNKPIYEILHRESSDRTIIITSGRKGEFKEQTVQWLKENNIPYDHLFMRKEGDVRKDFEVKNEIYNTWIKGQFNVVFVLDDRNQVVELWRSLGLTCLQVAEGDF